VATLTANAVSFTVMGTILGVVLTTLLAITNALDVLIPGVPLWLFLLALSSLPFALLSGYLSTILQGLQQIRTVNNVKLLLALSNLGLLIVFLYWVDLGIQGAIYASVLSSLMNVFAFAWYLRRHGAEFTPRWDRAVMQETLLFGLRGYFGNILQFFNYRLDVFIVNFFLGPVSVGIYSVATKLAELVWYFPNAVSFVIFPKSAATEAQEMNRFTPRVFQATILISVLASLALAFVARPLISFIYTNAFRDAYWPLLALLPGVILLGAGRVLTSDIAGRGYPQYNSISSATTLVLTIVLDLMLIPRFGILGASIASSIAYTFTFLMTLWFYRIVSHRETNIQTLAPQ
jgi:O-antigen/teichoic acid export membrane protein